MKSFGKLALSEFNKIKCILYCSSYLWKSTEKNIRCIYAKRWIRGVNISSGISVSENSVVHWVQHVSRLVAGFESAVGFRTAQGRICLPLYSQSLFRENPMPTIHCVLMFTTFQRFIGGEFFKHSNWPNTFYIIQLIF